MNKPKNKQKNLAALGLTRHDPSESLRNTKLVLETFIDCLQEGDDQAALEVLAGGLKYMNKARLAKKYGIPRRTTYNLLIKGANPSLSVIAKVCHALSQESTRPQ